MDRTAWIAVVLCVIGLVLWEWWLQKQNPARLRPAPATASPAAATPIAGISPPPFASTTASPGASPTAQPAPSAPTFAEKSETLANADVELHLTNRGGGIRDAILLHHLAEGDKPVILNSADQPPIGSIV